MGTCWAAGRKKRNQARGKQIKEREIHSVCSERRMVPNWLKSYE